MQVMYGIDGRTELPERELGHLAGYRGSAPVRIGNAAAKQLQLDIYGELMDSVYLYDRWHRPISSAHWDTIITRADWLCDHWDQLLALFVLSPRPGWRRTGWLLLAPGASALGLMAYHFALYGFFDPRRVYGRRPEFSLATLPEGLPGLLLDQEFGLLVYAPVFALVAGRRLTACGARTGASRVTALARLRGRGRDRRRPGPCGEAGSTPGALPRSPRSCPGPGRGRRALARRSRPRPRPRGLGPLAGARRSGRAAARAPRSRRHGAALSRRLGRRGMDAAPARLRARGPGPAAAWRWSGRSALAAAVSGADDPRPAA